MLRKLKPWSRETHYQDIGDVKVGGTNPISVQSMTNTLTTDVKATIEQVNQIHDAGAKCSTWC